MSKRLKVASSNTSKACLHVRAVMQAVGDIAYDWISDEAAEKLLLQGTVDIAVLDAKDIAAPLPEGLTLAALIDANPSISENIAVVCHADRADMRGLFYLTDMRNRYGKVWLIGAGAGSADLLTLRAERVLRKVDVVYYDDLVDESILSLSPGECVYVGKRKGRPSHSQDLINEQLYRSALEGKTVGRLKGGDPSIFGRAGEELAFLRSRWISVETIPGITAASAAAAAGLFSLTQRQVSKSITFLSGHGIDHSARKTPDKETRVYYMAASKLVEISRELICDGVSPEMPVVLVHNAGAWNESIVSSTVEGMTNIVAPAPALLIVGHIATHAYIEKKALYTGINPDYVKVKEPVVHQPLIMRVPAYESNSSAIEKCYFKTVEPKPSLVDLSYFSAIIFTSPETVDAFEIIYGALPDHLLCYVVDEITRQDLQRRNVLPWRIVMCPIRSSEQGESFP
jgi:uroporphyrin-III C-methyltransferase